MEKPTTANVVIVYLGQSSYRSVLVTLTSTKVGGTHTTNLFNGGQRCLELKSRRPIEQKADESSDSEYPHLFQHCEQKASTVR